MKVYVIEQSNNEVKKAYSALMDKINGHIRLLAENRKPFTSMIGIKRGLLRLKIGYFEEADASTTSTRSVLNSAQKKEINLNEKLELLAGEFMEKYQLDIKEIIDVGLIGEKEIIKALVRKEYEEMAKLGMKYKDIKVELSKKYGISVSSIEKLMYRKPLCPADISPKGEKIPTLISKTEEDG
jgi:hypothetical protein